MGGTPCFAGTRAPIQTPLDYVGIGETLAEFLEDFPGVSRALAVKFLEEAKTSLLANPA